MSDNTQQTRTSKYNYTTRTVLVEGKEVGIYTIEYSDTTGVSGAKVTAYGDTIPDGVDVVCESQYLDSPIRRDTLRNVRRVGDCEYVCDSIEWGVVGNDVRDVSALEKALRLPSGSIEAHQLGEKRADSPIAFSYGDLENSQTAYAANPVKEAVFVIDIASSKSE